MQLGKDRGGVFKFYFLLSCFFSSFSTPFFSYYLLLPSFLLPPPPRKVTPPPFLAPESGVMSEEVTPSKVTPSVLLSLGASRRTSLSRPSSGHVHLFYHYCYCLIIVKRRLLSARSIAVLYATLRIGKQAGVIFKYSNGSKVQVMILYLVLCLCLLSLLEVYECIQES